MLEFNRVKHQNFYTARYFYNGFYFEILKSYNTIVGLFISPAEIFEVKYSPTTSKQISQYTGVYSNEPYRIVVSAEELHNIIKAQTGLDLNCNYGGAR